jgi:NADPH:quinone reductase-like Zn-dependent oxidoreductase
VIDHYAQDIAAEARKLTGKRGVDVVFEHVGVATWPKSLESLAAGGRRVTCGATTGYEAALALRYLFARQWSLLGSFMGSMGELHEVLKFVFRGQLRPVIDRVFPLDEIRAAHERLERKEQFGKIVIRP